MSETKKIDWEALAEAMDAAGISYRDGSDSIIVSGYTPAADDRSCLAMMITIGELVMLSQGVLASMNAGNITLRDYATITHMLNAAEINVTDKMIYFPGFDLAG